MVEEELSSGLDLVEAFELKNVTLLDFSCETVVLLCDDFTRRIWSQPRLWNFTDHGLPHSYRLLSRLLELSTFLTQEPGEELSGYERLVVVMSGLLHDIGLQYQRHPDNGRSERGELCPEDIRHLHGKLGLEMIQDTLDRDKHERRGLPPLLQDEPYRTTLLDHVSKIAFAHQGDDLWKALRDGPFNDRQLGGSFRPRLLAALVRLADELDCDTRRVPSIYELKKESLPTVSRMHWTMCYYVQDVQIKPEKGLRIFIRWRAPLTDDPSAQEETKLIGEVVAIRKEHVEREFDECSDYLVSSEANGAPPAYRVSLVGPSQVALEPIPLDVAELIRGQLAKVHPPTEEEIANLERLPVPEALLNSAIALVEPDLYRMHFVLESGWHTNTFLKCRNLVTDHAFMRQLVDILAAHYSAKRINAICAIGTSALAIAVLLAERLGATLTFTFGGAQRKERYDELEWKPLLDPDSKVLVIDDILGLGNVALENIKEIVSQFQPTAVHFFALFSLGTEKETLKEMPDVTFTYLHHIDDVEYWLGDDNQLCQVCKSEPRKRVWEYPPLEAVEPKEYPVYATYPVDVLPYYEDESGAGE